MKKLSSELKTLLECSIEEWNSYDWNKLTPKQVENCAVFLKVTNNFDKLKHLIEILLKTDNKFSVVCIFEKYPELIKLLQLNQAEILIHCINKHTRNCKYFSDEQWQAISDFSQKYAHSRYAVNAPQTYGLYHNNMSLESQNNTLICAFKNVIMNPQYHEYIAKFIRFNIQIQKINNIFDAIERELSTPMFNNIRDSISKIIQYIKTTKWYKDNLVGDEVGYNIENCPVDGINAQDLRDLFE